MSLKPSEKELWGHESDPLCPPAPHQVRWGENWPLVQPHRGRGTEVRAVRSSGGVKGEV